VQNEVRRDMLGAATATLTFSRNIGGMLGVSVMGAILTASVTSQLLAATLTPHRYRFLHCSGEGRKCAWREWDRRDRGNWRRDRQRLYCGVRGIGPSALLVTLLAPGHVIGARGSVGQAADRSVAEPEPSEG